MLLKNIASLLVAGGLGALLSYTLHHNGWLPCPHWLYSLAYFIILCFILNMVYAAQAGGKSFSQLLLGGIVVKLLLSMIIVLVYAFTMPAGFFAFALHFIMHYVLFTIFEIRYLLQLIKNHTSQAQDHEN